MIIGRDQGDPLEPWMKLVNSEKVISLTCLGCNTNVAIELPMDVLKVVTTMKAWHRSHAECQTAYESAQPRPGLNEVEIAHDLDECMRRLSGLEDPVGRISLRTNDLRDTLLTAMRRAAGRAPKLAR